MTDLSVNVTSWLAAHQRPPALFCLIGDVGNRIEDCSWGKWKGSRRRARGHSNRKRSVSYTSPQHVDTFSIRCHLSVIELSLVLSHLKMSMLLPASTRGSLFALLWCSASHGDPDTAYKMKGDTGSVQRSCDGALRTLRTMPPAPPPASGHSLQTKAVVPKGLIWIFLYPSFGESCC